MTWFANVVLMRTDQTESEGRRLLGLFNHCLQIARGMSPIVEYATNSERLKCFVTGRPYKDSDFRVQPPLRPNDTNNMPKPPINRCR